MEISRYCCYILVNCLLIPSLLSKSISLNDIIKAEETSAYLKQSQPKLAEKKSKSENHKLTSTLLTRHMTTGSVVPTNKIVSPLKYKKTYQIRTPLRPKKIKYSYKPRSRRINTTTKREINDEKFNRNYIPLLKSLSVLFDNILSSNSREDDYTDQYYNRRPPASRSEECSCAYRSNHKNRKSKKEQKAAISTSTVTTKIPSKAKTINFSETSSTSSYNSFPDNIESRRRNKKLPVLPPGNTTSSRRNHNGFGEGGISAHYRNTERDISGNNGNDENNNSTARETESDTEIHYGNPNSYSGDDASCSGPCGAIGRDGDSTENVEFEETISETNINASTETYASVRRDSDQHKRFDRLETRSNETKSRKLLPQSNTRLRGHTSEEETTELSWQIQGPKESTVNDTYDTAGYQRVFDRDGSLANEDKKLRRSNQTLRVRDYKESPYNTTNANQKIVMIYDGYSVARDVNGDNKLTEKAYRIHT